MIPPEHKALLTRIKKVFVAWNTERYPLEEKMLDAYHEVKQLYEVYGYAALRYAFHNAKGKRSFIACVKRKDPDPLYDPAPACVKVHGRKLQNTGSYLPGDSTNHGADVI